MKEKIMSYINPLDALTTTSGKAFFNKDSLIGESVTGVITEATVRQVNDFTTGKPKFWDDGNPVNQVVVSIDTDLRDDADDTGERTLYIKTWGSQWKALKEAVRVLGTHQLSDALKPGNVITQSFTGLGKTGNGFDEKIYTFQIKRGADPALNKINEPTTAGSDPWGEAPTPTPASAPAAPAAAAPSVPALIAAGLTDEQILASVPGLDKNILAMLRGQN